MSDHRLLRNPGRGPQYRAAGTILVVAGLLLLAPGSLVHAQVKLTQADLLRRVIDLKRLVLPPAGETPGLAAGNIKQQPVTDDGWHALADLKGPGIITRTWIAPRAGLLRIVLDGNAVIEADLEKWHAGLIEPIQAPLIDRSGNCYFPLGFADRAQILVKSAQGPFQINYLRLPTGTTVQASTRQLDEPAQAALEDVLQALTRGYSERQLFGQRRLMPVAKQQDLKPGDTLRETLDFPGTVRACYVGITDHGEPGDLYPLHRCLLRVWFDNAEDPQIEVPLIDFFGCGFDRSPANSLVAGTNLPLHVPLPDRRSGRDRFMYCYLPMPFHQGLRLEIENLNRGRKALGLLLYLEVEPQAPPNDALHLNAGYRRYWPAPEEELTLFKSRTATRIVGWTLNVDCPRAGWSSRATHRVKLRGAGTETWSGDALTHSFGQTTPMRRLIDPLVGVTRAGRFSKRSAYRWLLADSITTTAGLHWTLHNQPPADADDIYIGSLVHWYGSPATRGTFRTLDRDALSVPGLRIPGAVEIEDHVLGRDWGSVIRQRHTNDVELSGQLAVHISTAEPVQVVIPSDRSRQVRLLLRANPRRPFETVTVTDDGGRRIGEVSYARRPDGVYPVGTLGLDAGNNTVTIQCSKPAMLDCWILEDTGESATEARPSDSAP